MLLSSASGAIAAKNYEAMLAALAEQDEPHENVDPTQITGLAPRAHTYPERAVYLRREGAIDARVLVGALEAAAWRRGVVIAPGTVRAVVHGAGAVRGVRLADGTQVAAGSVVLADRTTDEELTTLRRSLPAQG